MIIENQTVLDLISKMAEIEVNTKRYESDTEDVHIPRVTEVLSAMLHEDGLMSWSNGLGWKRISYRAFMREAADKGTYSHLAIEKFLTNGFVDLEEMNIPERIFPVVQSCMDGFMLWWKQLHTKYKTVEIVFLEETMIHSYFRGTCDCLMKLDGEYYLIDFKTSNHMSYNYPLQLAAYRFLLRELKGIRLSGATVLVVSKTDHDYKSYDLDFNNKEHVTFIEDCEQTFLTLVSAYKMRLYTTEEYHNVYGIEKYKKK